MSIKKKYSDFEFERRFYVENLPDDTIKTIVPDILIQTYFFSAEGYGIRIRLQASQPKRELKLDTDPKQSILDFEPDYDRCVLTVKGPINYGTRYEAERDLEISVGVEMCLLGSWTIAKRRYRIEIGTDEWIIDEFAKPNQGLVIAECERINPVVDLEIPKFCTSEITTDVRFSNDQLIYHPFSQWKKAFLDEIYENGPKFMENFGTNRIM